MTIFYVPPLEIVPEGLRQLLKKGDISGVVALKHLDHCYSNHEGCDNCPFRQQCRAEWDSRVDVDKIKGWGKVGRHNVS